MRQAFFPVAAVLIAAVAVPAHAALPLGARAPAFTTMGAVGGKPFRLDLKDQLRHGPLVLYFFPKAFTQGCTLEAHAFSEAIGDFRKAGARVVGVSADDLDTLKRFSVEECRNAFPVAQATPAMIKGYDVELKQKPGLTDRTSYVIDRNGRIVFVHSDLNYAEHVAKTLAAVRSLKK